MPWRLFSRRPRVQPVAPCPFPGELFVLVTRSDTGAAVVGAQVALAGGPTAGAKPTNGVGSAAYQPCAQGQYTVSVSLADRNAALYEVPDAVPNVAVTVGQQTFCDVVVDPYASLVVELLRSTDRAPVAKADVVVTGPSNRAAAPVRPSSARTTPTAFNGKVHFPQLSHGDYTVDVTPPAEYVAVAQSAVTLVRGQQQVLQLLLPPKPSLHVTVKRNDTQAVVAGVKVRSIVNGHTLEATGGGDGVARLDRVEAGNHSVGLMLDPDQTKRYLWDGVAATPVLANDGATTAIDLLLEPKPTLKVTVRNEDSNEVVAGVKVRALLAGAAAPLELTSSAQGVSSFEFIDAGNYSVEPHLEGETRKQYRWRPTLPAVAPPVLPRSGAVVGATLWLKPRKLELVSVDDHFAPSVETLDIKYHIKNLSGRTVKLEITGTNYPNNPVYSRNLSDAERDDGDDKIIAWDGKANCPAGPLAGTLYINPKYAPYKVKLSTNLGHDGVREVEFKVLYHSVVLEQGTWVPGAAPARLADPIKWAQYELNRLGYFAGPVTGAVTPQLQRAVARYTYAHEGLYAGQKEIQNHADASFVTHLANGDGALTWLQGGALPAEGTTARAYIDHDYFFSSIAEFSQADGAVTKDQAKLDRWETPLECRVLLVGKADDGTAVSVGINAPAAVGDIDIRFHVEDPAEDTSTLPTNKPRNADIPSPVREYVNKALKATRAGDPDLDNCPQAQNGERASSTDRDYFRVGVELEPYTVTLVGDEIFGTCSVDPAHAPKLGRAGALFRGSTIAGDDYILHANVSFTQAGVDLGNKATLQALHEAHHGQLPANANRKAEEVLARKTGKIVLWRRHHAAAVVNWPASGRAVNWGAMATAYAQALCEFDAGAAQNLAPVALFALGSPEETQFLGTMQAAFDPTNAFPAPAINAELFPWALPAQGIAEDDNDYYGRLAELMQDFGDADGGQMMMDLSTQIAARVRATCRAGAVIWEMDWCPAPVIGGVAQNQFGLFCQAGPDGVVQMNNQMTATEQPGFLYSHEVAHTRFLWHHETSHSRGLRGLFRLPNYDSRQHHDLSDHNCTMSYPNGVTSRPRLSWDIGDTTEARFCGKCTLKLRGWRIITGLPDRS
ncbi:hypothetical protein RA210_U160039 [Rubrivivax sp. A210]|uniref:hypothetical protein n=1 Tax=Rubrivivax sp. A210 TaxID=2772301 RepID=UPI00191A7DC1|nr:hypothetical protein [Rubrivivax sp. A210]CAD5371655.1 hypothetical protein RA210_U160039 [Rubrivivax sp. A210]